MKMKKLMKAMVAAGLMVAGGMGMASAAHADSFVPLIIPNGPGCTGSKFNADGTVTAACQLIKSAPCSGRGCQPVRYITRYVATFDQNGASLGSVMCSYTRHHFPQPDAVIYYNGYDATTCLGTNYDPTYTTVVLDSVPFYYVTTNSVTGQMLVNSNVTGYLYTP